MDPPTLAYGRSPRPGSISSTVHPDGSLTIQIIPRSWPQILPTAAFIVGFVLLFILFLYYISRSQRDSQLLIIGGVVLSMMVPAALFAYSTISRQQMQIQAGPDGLRIWTKEFGDDVTYEIPRDQIVWAGIGPCPEGGETPSLGLLVVLPDRRRWFQIHRPLQELEPLTPLLHAALRLSLQTVVPPPTGNRTPIDVP